jgi:predicted nucleic acid-binding protein
MSRDYLFDTNVLSVFAQLKNGVTTPQCEILAKKLKDRQGSRIFLCPICVGEIQRGVRIAPDVTIQKDIEKIIASFHEVLPINEAVAADCYSVLWARLYKQYASRSKKVGSPEKIRERERLNKTYTLEMGVQENDLWLAAVAMCYNLVLVTSDKMNRIRRISNGDVVFENWLEP